MSPEQCRGKALDARSDVFALGTILYELTTGEPPFHAATDFEILNKIVNGPPEPPRWTGERPYPPALAAIVMRALAPDPAERTPTAQALQIDLEAFARQERLEVSTVALAAFMQSLFADELAAWREAQRAGKSLADHLAEREGRAPAADATRTATDAFAATRRVAPGRAARRRTVAAAAVVALMATGGLLAASRGKHAGTPAPVAETPPAGSANGAIAPVPAAPPSRKAHDVSTAARAENNVEAQPASPTPDATPHVASSARGQDKGASRRGARARVRRAEPTAAPPSNESRLHAWDPDSPVPP